MRKLIHAEGAMADRIRAFDWSATPIGGVGTWPERLIGAVEAMLAAPQIASLVIGPERIFLYNDEASRHYGDRHPAVLGQPIGAAFAHEFAAVAPFYDRVFGGESVHVPAQPLDPANAGEAELFDAWLTPVRGADGAVIAAAMIGFAIGARVRAEAARRLREGERRAGLERRIDAAADALQANRDLLQGTIDSSDDMIQVFEAVRHADGAIVDFRWILTNRTSEDRYGMTAGASLLERNPGVVDEGIFDAFKRVTETGVPEQAEHHYVHEQFDEWFYQSVVRLGDGVATTTRAIDAWKAAQADILRLQAEAADAKLSESEARYRTLFETIGQGFCVIEMIFDDAGIAVDYLFLEANPAFIAQSGLAAPVGRRMRDLAPDADQSWFDTYGRVARTGRPERFERQAPPLGRWHDIYAFRTGDPQARRVGVLFDDIGDRKAQEAALLDSRQRFQALATAGNYSIYRMSPDWRMMYALNSVTLAATAEPIVDWVDKYIPHDDRAEVFAAIDLAIRTKSLFELEHRVIMADGTVGWVRSRAVPLLGPDGEITEWFGAGADVTERREAVERLRKSEERLRQFGEASQDVLWIRDADTLCWTYLTPAFEPIYGISREEALAGDNYRSWLDLIVPEDRAHAMKSIERVRAGESISFEFRIRRPSDSAIRWMRNTDFPITSDDGEVRLIGGIGRDITDLHDTQQWLEMLIDGIPQLVWRGRGRGEWTWASPQWTAFTGQSEPDSHGLGWLQPMHPDDRDRVMAVWADAAERGEFEADYRLCDARHQRYRWFHTRATPVRDAGGDIVEWLGTSTDIDDLRQMQDRQQLLLAELQHRVRNMLAVVRSVFARTIAVEAPIDELADHFRGRLDSLARTQGGVTQSASGLVDLENLIRDELLSVGAHNGPHLIIDGPDVALPPKAAESIGLAIHELTTNALKYGALKVPGARLEIRWSDNIHYSGGRMLNLSWTEQGVPAVPLKPARHGFGMELITEALPYRLGAETSLKFRGGGVCCTISMPLSD